VTNVFYQTKEASYNKNTAIHVHVLVRTCISVHSDTQYVQ